MSARPRLTSGLLKELVATFPPGHNPLELTVIKPAAYSATAACIEAMSRTTMATETMEERAVRFGYEPGQFFAINIPQCRHCRAFGTVREIINTRLGVHGFECSACGSHEPPIL